ncbi:MAG: zinc-ribbon domain-containing protein [Candidatus Micrarchaeota archaeon]|nr:zinc-ribbon domain-containing protein [Candidatus Micrarchaeota archaeon]
MKFCTECGKELVKPGEKYCTECGAAVVERRAQSQDAQSKGVPLWKSGPKRILAVLALMAVTFYAVFSVTQAALAGAGSNVRLSSLSAGSLAPMQLLSVSGSGFDRASFVVVGFAGGKDYSVEVPAVFVNSTTVIVAVPPFIDTATGKFSEGDVKVRVRQRLDNYENYSNAIDFHIRALPESKQKPGQVTLDYLDALASFARDLEKNATGTSAGAQNLRDALAKQAAAFEKIAAQVRNVVDGKQASFVLGKSGGEALIVDKEVLAGADRMIYAQLMAQANPAQAVSLEGAPSELLFSPGGCMEQEAGSWQEDIGTGNYRGADSHGYVRASTVSMNCKSVQAFTAGYGVVGGAAGIAAGIAVLAFGLPASAIAGSILLSVTLIGGAGLILVGGTLGQDAPGAKEMVVTGVKQIEEQLMSLLRTGAISALGAYSETTGAAAEMGNAVGDAIDGVFSIRDALEVLPNEATPTPTPTKPPGGTVVPTPTPAKPVTAQKPVALRGCRYDDGTRCASSCCSTGMTCSGKFAFRACDARTGNWGQITSDASCRKPCERDDQPTPTPKEASPTPEEPGGLLPTSLPGGLGADKPETWLGDFTTARFVCNAAGGAHDGKLEGTWIARFTVPRSLVKALEPDGSIGEWEEQDGEWSGMESVTQACSSLDFGAGGGSVSKVALKINVHDNRIYLGAKTDVLMPGKWFDSKNPSYFGGRIGSIALVPTSVSATVITGTFDLNPGTGTFTLRKPA